VDQPLVLIKHRASDEDLALVEDILRCFRSRYVYMSYEEHDSVTANTQAVTHAAFLSMGTAWSSAQSYPWEYGSYVGGIETVKVNIMLRIYSNQWHVYAGLAILNPSARHQITQYSSSVTQLFKLMITGDEQELRKRLYDARERVFGFAAGCEGESLGRAPILLSEKVLDQFSLGKTPHAVPASLPEPHSLPAPPITTSSSSSLSPSSSSSTAAANSHLSLLAMVDCWAALGIQPYFHLELAATPIFRLWIGVAEYLFRSSTRLNAAIHAAIHDVSHRYDDLEFVVAARGWSQCVNFGNFELYRRRFQESRAFFEPRFEDAVKVGSAMIKAISENNSANGQSQGPASSSARG
jgi:prephenate dehydrogenase (NADP+)